MSTGHFFVITLKLTVAIYCSSTSEESLKKSKVEGGDQEDDSEVTDEGTVIGINITVSIASFV